MGLTSCLRSEPRGRREPERLRSGQVTRFKHLQEVIYRGAMPSPRARARSSFCATYQENHVLDAMMLALAPPVPMTHLEEMQFLRDFVTPVVVAEAPEVPDDEPAPVVRDQAPHVHPAPEPEPEPHVHPEPAPAARDVADPAPYNGVWDRLAECEANGEWDYGPHSGWGSGIFEGGLQHHPQTWDEFKPDGYPDAAYQATREQQIAVAKRVLAAQGVRAWPNCGPKVGLTVEDAR